MKIAIRLLSLIVPTLCLACSPSPQAADPRMDQSEAFQKLLDAHGDWKKWVEAKTLSYSMVHETTLEQENYFISLPQRKIRIDAETFQIGYDGSQVWISPSREAFGGNSVRFYHNLYFYFFAIPYIFTDPGVQVKKTEDHQLNGQQYGAYEVTFDTGTGASPNDRYYLLIDPETGRLSWLLYTVTYFDKNNTSLSALKYEDYREIDGLLFPRILTGYTYENDSTGRIRYQVSFSDIHLTQDLLDEKLFAKPEGALVAND